MTLSSCFGVKQITPFRSLSNTIGQFYHLYTCVAFVPFPVPFPKASASTLGKNGVPNPVTASHPVFAGKPVELQPMADPLVTSVNALYP